MTKRILCLLLLCYLHLCTSFSILEQPCRRFFKSESMHKISQKGIEIKRHVQTLTTYGLLLLPFVVTSSLPAEAATDDFFSRADAQYYQSSSKLGFIPQQNYDSRKATAMKQIIDLQNFQDERLDQCVDKGQDWEQCFMFGESSSVTFADGQGNDWQKGLGIKIPFNKLRGPDLPVPEQGTLLGGEDAARGNVSRRPPTW